MQSSFAQSVLEKNVSILASATGGAYCNNAAVRFTPFRTEEETWQTDAIESKAKPIKSKMKSRNARREG